jgi:hypothetical protein
MRHEGEEEHGKGEEQVTEQGAFLGREEGVR